MTGSTVLYDAPGPRALLHNRIITVITVLAAAGIVAVVLVRLDAKGQLAAVKWEPFTTANLWRTYILPGVQGTLTAAALSIALAVAFGVALAVGRMSSAAPTRRLCGAVVEFFRAVPVLILMIFAYFLYALHDVFPARQLALAGVVTGLTLYNAAVIAEIVRAGVHSLPRGQSEAAAALGLRDPQTMRLILLPQAITAMLPALVSQLVVVLKDTAIGYQITFVEMVRQGTVVGSQYRNYLPALLVIAALMITVNVTLSGLATRLEARLRRSRRSPAPPAPATTHAVTGPATPGDILTAPDPIDPPAGTARTSAYPVGAQHSRDRS
jgi:glutamate transport system permease protein